MSILALKGHLRNRYQPLAIDVRRNAVTFKRAWLAWAVHLLYSDNAGGSWRIGAVEQATHLRHFRQGFPR